MDSNNKKLVLFDFDGVLVDTLGICYSINQKVHDNLSVEEYKSFFTGNIFDAVRKDGSPKNPHPDFFKDYDSGTREVIIPELLKSVVKELSNNYLLFIVSSTYTKSIKRILEKENMLEYFTEVLGADIERNKVTKIKFVLNKYKKNFIDAVFITDTLGDIREAGECDVKSIAVSWGYHDKETLQKGNPAYLIDDPKKLISTIDSVLK